ncbi:BatD family protein [Fusobacterium mortiferum]|uniref:BatD family protein n=1 Tax=Fusobacterium mortiferum TaxID=850 RepID=A0ABS2G5P5_FUSMR|nr:BatD family protein [Fusobacterium mortiferum]MBM6876055.1 BatD family protein [Fusobacterium mortiferum]
MKKIVATLFLMTSFLSLADVILDSSNTKPAINEPFNIQVKFINEDKKDYKIEGIENLEILSKGTQSKYSYINGNKTSEKIDTYTVLAKDIINFPLTVNLIGKNEKSNTLNISVQKESIQSISDDMSIETSINNGDTFYFGEKIIYEENFLTTVNINSIGYTKPPQFNDFSEKDISPANLKGAYEQSYFRSNSGKQGIKLNIYRGILQPNSSGEKTIKSGQMAVTQASGRRDFFFQQSTPPKYFGGNNIKINILPLPTDKPVGFQNIVGTPKLEYSWNSDKVNLGQSLVLNIKISGDANLDALEKIVTSQFNDFNIFESFKGEDERVENGKYYAEKSFELALIPKKSGEINTPEIKIPYFNTQNKKYEFLIIPSKKIDVIGSSSSPQATIPIENTTHVTKNTTPVSTTLIPEEIRIDTVTEKDNSNNIFDNNLIIGLIILAIIEGGIIIYLLTKKDKKIESKDFSELKSAKNDKEFYEAYCNFMKKNYNFSPKVHLEDRLVKLGLSKDFIEINRELETSYYNNSPINRKEIINRIKKELKNEK